MITRHATAKWTGGFPEGSGSIATDSKVLDNTQYAFKTRFENGEGGTNPEELIAASHSGCYSMALTAMLGANGFTPNSVSTTAAVVLDKVEGNWTITKSQLTTEIDIDGIDDEKLNEIALQAKAGCPISRVLNAEITLELKRTTGV